MQPTFNPWLGYFDLIDTVDTFVFLNNVQLEKRSWQVRNKIKSNNQEFFITIPIKKTAHRDDILINNAIISNFDWANKALKTIKHSYMKSKYYEEVFPFIESLLLNRELNILSDFNIYIIKKISDKIGITSDFVESSNINNLAGSKDDLLLSICKELKASNYISPQGSSIYLQENNSGNKYNEYNIKLYYSNYVHPKYKQIGKNFIEYIGIFDLLFNEGFTNALHIIRSGHRENIFYKDFDNENR